MKQILIDESSNVFSFDEEIVMPLGKAITFKNLWQDKIFAIGEDIYRKMGQKYSLLAAKSKFFGFHSSDPYADKQFEVIGNEVLYVEQGIPGIVKFPNLEEYAPLYAPELENIGSCAFAIGNDKRMDIYVQNAELGLVRSESKAVFYQDALVWSGHGYLIKDGILERVPWRLQYVTKAYIIMRLGKVLFSFYADGKVEALGVEEKRVNTKNGEVLVVEKDKVVYCYYLGADILQQVVSVYGEDDSYHINTDGAIEHHYVYSVEYEDFNAYDRYELREGKYERVNKG